MLIAAVRRRRRPVRDVCARRTAPVLLCAAVCRVAAVDLVIVHYELLGEAEPRLLAALANSVRNVRAVERHVIVVNAAGANLTGVAADAHAVGVQSVAELGTVPLISHASGATVAVNLRLPAPLTASVPASVTLELAGAGRVGLIGVVPAALQAELAGAAVTDPVEAVREEAGRLRRAGVGTLLALGRLVGAEAVQLARRVPELDALVVPGGLREQEVYPRTVLREEGGALPLLEAPQVAAPGYLGMVTVTLATDGRLTSWRGRVMPLRAPALQSPPAADPPRPAVRPPPPRSGSVRRSPVPWVRRWRSWTAGGRAALGASARWAARWPTRCCWPPCCRRPARGARCRWRW